MPRLCRMWSRSVAQNAPLPGLSTTTSPARGCELRHDLVAVLAAHQHPPHRARIADALAPRPRTIFVGGQIGEIRAVAFARVDDHHAHAARRLEHAPARRDHRLQRRDVVAERLAEAAGLDEIALHVDDDQRRGRQIEREFVRFGLHRSLSHVASARPALAMVLRAAKIGSLSRALASASRSTCRSSLRRGAKTRRCGSSSTCTMPASRFRRWPSSKPEMTPPDINRPEILSEVREAFALYEQALVGNDTAALDDLFWHSEAVVRYGGDREPGRHRGDPRLSRGAAERRPGAHARQHRDHHLRQGFRHRHDRVPARELDPRRPAEPDLGAISRRLARCRSAREPARAMSPARPPEGAHSCSAGPAAGPRVHP